MINKDRLGVKHGILQLYIYDTVYASRVTSARYIIIYGDATDSSKYIYYCWNSLVPVYCFATLSRILETALIETWENNN